jgi:hypothetical protein
MHMYVLNLFYINDLYLKCPLCRGAHTLPVCSMYPVYSMYTWGMYGTCTVLLSLMHGISHGMYGTCTVYV